MEIVLLLNIAEQCATVIFVAQSMNLHLILFPSANTVVLFTLVGLPIEITGSVSW